MAKVGGSKSICKLFHGRGGYKPRLSRDGINVAAFSRSIIGFRLQPQQAQAEFDRLMNWMGRYSGGKEGQSE
jgi:hypothetical protein